jgi:D-glycero-alpha-D-manno-heptose-7-phosphate kinase
MGASSAFAVGLIKALHAYKFPDQIINKNILAELACNIEIDLCKKPIGKQDQYACAYGGFNAHIFEKDNVQSESIKLDFETLKYLEENLLLLYTTKGRSANDILKNQSEKMVSNEKSFQNMQLMVDLAKQFKSNLQKQNLTDFGEMLDYSWQLKKEVSNGISNLELDEIYEVAKNCGAKGGKILGAGGGGFMLLFADPKSQIKIKDKLSICKPFNFNFEFDGASVSKV